MPHLSKFRIFKGWVKEFLYILLIPLHFFPGLLIRFNERVGEGKTIIIVADLFCQSLFYYRLRRALVESGFSVLVAKTGSAFSSLHEQARYLSKILEKNDIDEGIVLGHGMGSLVALALPDAGRQRIEHLVSLGTPFHGSRLFLYGSFIPAIRDMAVGSNFLLFNRMNALLFPSFTPFIAWQDEWIVPFNLAQFGQGRDLIFDEVGHFNLVMSQENVQTLAEHMREFYDPSSSLPLDLEVDENAGKPASAKAGARASGARPARARQGAKKPARPGKKSRPGKSGRR